LFGSGQPCIFRRLKIRQKFRVKSVPTLLLVVGCQFTATADGHVIPAAANSWTSQNARFGLFDWLDHRSGYYQDGFPQALIVDDTSLEPEGELELNELHTGAGSQHSDVMSVEFQKSVGVVTFELELPYERISNADGLAKGIGGIEFQARCPVYQYMSGNGFFDNTMGAIGGAGIPVWSPVSRNTELEGGLFDDVKLGDHFTVQSVLGYDQLFGGGDDGGLEEFDYGLVFAWRISHEEMPLPGIERFTPMFEIKGELGLNQDEAGQNNVLGNMGFRADFRSIAGLEPSLGLSYVFPMSSAARDEVHWGVAVNVTIGF
jgi:hypothetical protein